MHFPARVTCRVYKHFTVTKERKYVLKEHICVEATGKIKWRLRKEKSKKNIHSMWFANGRERNTYYICSLNVFHRKKGAKFLTDCLYIEYSTYTYKLVFWVSFIGLFYNLHVKLFHFLADIFFHNENYGKKYCEKEKCCGK